ncbi:hypothetical protein R5H32_20120 [Defluviimonas sp. D31]|uniref:hypothetical protein n=1 Tax=Defluviimonas sp. D31 TaxID=3083253 RepID=UPI00296EE61F|nr:hypothetical protein [Defluviimonas sp. D31]MDW4551646.1 hypothetical protein [Defluviimonas sp. D31]
MSRTTKAFASCIALALSCQGGFADTVREAALKSHPSQGEVHAIQGARVALATSTAGVHFDFQSAELHPGHAYTLLMAVMNRPSECPALPCTPKDVLGRSDIVRSDVGVVGGAVARADGTLYITGIQKVGALPEAFFGHGLQDPPAAEIHFVLNDHGPAIEGRMVEMLGTYRGGCTDESLPPPMPAAARASGNTGPNTCRLVQNVQFLPERPES